MIKIINFNNIKVLNFYIKELKVQTYNYINLKDLNKLYNIIKIIEKFNIIKFKLKTKDPRSTLKYKIF